MSPKELARRLDREPLALFDTNSKGSWERAHLPGARPLDPTRFGPEDLPADRAASIVFYCSGPLCRKAPLAARRARDLGYTNAVVLSAGISGWIDAGLPTETAPERDGETR